MQQALQAGVTEAISIYEGRVEYVPLQTRVRKILGVIAILSNARKEGTIGNADFALHYPEAA